MITAKELAKKLRAYAQQSPEHANAEIMLVYNESDAFPFAGANDTQAMNTGTKVKRFLVFQPDMKGDRLELKSGIAH